MPRLPRSRRAVVGRRVARRAAALLIAAGATVAPGTAVYAAEEGTTTRRLSDGTVAPPPAVVEPPPDWVDPFAVIEPEPEEPTVATPVVAIAEPPADPVAEEHPADGPLFGAPVAEAALIAETAQEEKQGDAATDESEEDGLEQLEQEVAEPAVMVLFDFAAEGARIEGAAGAAGDPLLAGEVTTAEELFAGAEPAAPLDPFHHPEPAVTPEPGPEPPAPLPPAPAGRARLALAEPPPVGRAFLEFAPVGPAPVRPAPAPSPVHKPVHTPNRLPSPASSGAPVAAALAPSRPVQPLPVQSLPGVRTAVARRPAPGAAPADSAGVSPDVPAVALPAAFGRFCPVAVRDARRLAAADPRVTTEFGGKTYRFASPVARAAFLLDPDRYLPVADGRDVVLAAAEGFAVPGRVEHAALYGGRLFLFRSARTRDAFAADPARFVDADAPIDRGATPIAAPGEVR